MTAANVAQSLGPKNKAQATSLKWGPVRSGDLYAHSPLWRTGGHAHADGLWCVERHAGYAPPLKRLLQTYS